MQTESRAGRARRIELDRAGLTVNRCPACERWPRRAAAMARFTSSTLTSITRAIVLSHALRCEDVLAAVHGKTPEYTMSPQMTAESDGMTT